jgi:hypothetical protein
VQQPTIPQAENALAQKTAPPAKIANTVNIALKTVELVGCVNNKKQEN